MTATASPTSAPAARLDLAFAIGFCHGQDRLWQLEFFRRATAGRLSEFSGPEALKVDRLMRTLGLARTAERESERDRERPARAPRRLRGRHQRGDRDRSRAADRVPDPAARARALVGIGPARLGQADGARPLDQLGDGALPRRARAPRRPRARGAARASVSAGEPDRHLAWRALRRRRRRHRRSDRAGQGGDRAHGAGRRLQQLGRLRRALGDRTAAARVRPASEHHHPRALLPGGPLL